MRYSTLAIPLHHKLAVIVLAISLTAGCSQSLTTSHAFLQSAEPFDLLRATAFNQGQSCNSSVFNFFIRGGAWLTRAGGTSVTGKIYYTKNDQTSQGGVQVFNCNYNAFSAPAPKGANVVFFYLFHFGCYQEQVAFSDSSNSLSYLKSKVFTTKHFYVLYVYINDQSMPYETITASNRANGEISFSTPLQSPFQFLAYQHPNVYVDVVQD